MPRYFFVLGRNPTLSVAEISSVFKLESIPFGIELISPEVLIINSEDVLDAKDLIKRLGGTVKIGKITDEVGFDEDEREFEKIFLAENIINNFLSKKEGKVHFGISIYDGGTDKKYLNKITDELKTYNNTIKENLREKGIRGGFVRIKERTLSSVSVLKNRLLSQGAEISLILTGDKILAGKTLEVQEFESFSFRDYGRPVRDKRSGIIPPKLARMMINLTQAPREGVFMDPFCGSGTVLQEAIILGYKNIVGSDISQNAISYTNRNLEWLFSHFKDIDKTVINLNIFVSDIRKITDRLKPGSVDVIVTEPYLGPPLFKVPDIGSAERIIAEVSVLYIDAFETFSRILRNGGKVAFLFPAFEVSGKKYFAEIIERIKKMGFKQMVLIPENISKNPTFNITNRNTIIYGDPGHFVKREITVWQKV